MSVRRRECLNVFPDAERVETAMLNAASEAKRLVDGRQYCTLAQLIERVAKTATLPCRPCSSLTARVILWVTARALPPGPFGDFVDEPAFARAAFALVQDLKGGLVTASQFAAAVRHLPSARAVRGRFLADLYSNYEKELQRRQLFDRGDLLRLASDALQSGAAASQVALFSEIAINGIYDLSPARVRFFLNLAKLGEAHNTILRLEIPASGTPALDGVVDSALAQFEHRGQFLSHLEVSKRDLSEAPLVAEAALLYSPGPVPTCASNALHIFSTANPTGEIREIARRVRQRVEDGSPPEQICVAYRDLGAEAESLEERLSELGIAVHFRRGAPVRSTTLGRLALDLPLLVDDRYPADAMAEFLSSRYAEAVHLPDGDSPARFFGMAAIRDDRLGAIDERGAYVVRLTALAERLKLKDKLAQANECDRLSSRCIKLFEICDSLFEEGRIKDLLRRWWKCLNKLGLLKAVRRAEPRGEEEGAYGREVLRAIARDQAAADSLRSMTSEFDAALSLAGAAHHRVSRRLFHRWLIDASLDFNLIPKTIRGGAVHLHDLLEVPGRSFQHVFVGGVIDGRFPRREANPGLFPDDDRAVVNRCLQRQAFRLYAGEGEARLPWKLAEDRLLFFLSLASASQGAILSYSRTQSDGREAIASPLLDETTRVFRLPVEHRKLQTIPVALDLQTETDLRERVAVDALSLRDVHGSPFDALAVELGKKTSSESWFVSAAEVAKIEEERLRFFSRDGVEVGRFSGYVLPSAELEKTFEFGPGQPLSASLLGKFGNCGYQGFLTYGLRLGETDRPSEEMDAREQGSLWHRVMENLFHRLNELELVGKPLDQIPEEVIDEAVQAADEESQSAGQVGHPILWAVGRSRARRMVRRLLASPSRGLPFEGQRPAHLELSFGRPDSPPEWRTVSIPAGPGEREIFFEGKIDRIDRGNGQLGVLDYKASAPTKILDGLLSTEFQLPLYLYAAKVAGHRGSVSAAWLSLKDGKISKLDDILAKGGMNFDSLLTTDLKDRATIGAFGTKNFSNAVHQLVSEMRLGHFPARPKDCTYCSYRAVCRISERRIPEMTGE